MISGPKGTFLYTNYRWVQELHLPLPKDREWDEDVSIKQLRLKKSEDI